MCRNCEKVQGTAKIFKQPCVRLFLKDVLPFRAGNSRTGSTRSVLPQFRWSFDHPQSKSIRIVPSLPGLDHRSLPALLVHCRRFLPGPADCVSETYESLDGSRLVIEYPAYACVRGEPRSGFLPSPPAVAD